MLSALIDLIVKLAVLAAALAIILSHCPLARAETPSRTASTGAYVSSMPPIYPDSGERKTNIWGTTEVVRCPDGFKLSFSSVATDLKTAPAPECIAISPQDLSGGAQ